MNSRRYVGAESIRFAFLWRLFFMCIPWRMSGVFPEALKCHFTSQGFTRTEIPLIPEASQREDE